jgi:hypothetical protein
MVSMPFLTQIDSRAQVRGSRDPLGVQAIWTRMGRHVVGNLTTVSTSVRDFTTTLLGFYFAERVAELKKERDLRVLDAVAKALKPKFSSAERALFVSHLVEGGSQDETKGGQKLLAEVLKSTLKVPNWELSPVAVRDMAKKCRTEKTDVGDQVAAYLERILAAEQLLAPCVSFFGYLLGSDRQSLDNVAKSVKKQWGSGVRSIDVAALQSIETELRDASGELASGQRWVAIATALREGDYAEASKVLLVQNREVMAMRGGAAPWAEIRNGKLHVKFAAEVSDVPTKEDLVSHWTHPYFIPSLREMVRQLEP